MGKVKKKKKILCNNQSIINVSNLYSKALQQKKTLQSNKAIFSKKSYPLTSKMDYCENTLKHKPVGISSFKGFVISSKLNTSKGNISVINSTGNANKSVSFDIADDAHSETIINHLDSSYSSLPCPNILRHKRENMNNLSNSPMKALTFSPSKFLNRNRIEEINRDLESSNQFLLSTTTCDLEDSGIVLAENESFSSLPLTSTPSSSQKFKKSFEAQQDRELHYTSSPFHSTPNALVEESSASPVLHQFLKLSVPRTPTPFKCNKNLSNKSEQEAGFNLSYSITESYKSRSVKSPTVVSAPLQASSISSLVKKGGSLCLEINHTKNSFRRILFDSKYGNKRLIGESPKQELLDEPVLKKEHALNFGKSITIRKKSKDQLKLVPLTSHWVNVACGRSYDQQVMTAAAKQCLLDL